MSGDDEPLVALVVLVGEAGASPGFWSGVGATLAPPRQLFRRVFVEASEMIGLRRNGENLLIALLAIVQSKND